MLTGGVEHIFNKPVRSLPPPLGRGVPLGHDQQAAAPPPSLERAQPIRAGQEAGPVHTQPVSFPIRLPDALQAEALRLLDASCAAINALLVGLWPELDRFAAERTGPAWKQVERYAVRRSGHGNLAGALRDGTGRQDPARPGQSQ